MSYKDLEAVRIAWLNDNWSYQMLYWDKFNYLILSNVIYKKKTGKFKSGTFSDVIMMADTETSKSEDYKELDEFGNPEPCENHVCAWSLSIRFFHRNIVTLYGSRPSEFTACLHNIRNVLPGDEFYLYFHNLSYDHFFLRRFIYKEFGAPTKTLNTKPHYPISLRFNNGMIIKDSLILAGCKLEKWANDLDVEHKKAVGSWEYDKVRNQDWISNITTEELKYIECDTLAGVECIDALCINLKKSVYSLPLTATGIIREEVRNRAKANKGHDWFLRMAPDFDLYNMMVRLYHGGFSHGSRFIIGEILNAALTRGFDFASSYPFCLISEKYPCTKFIKHDKKEKPDYILRNSDKFAFLFRISFINIRLKDPLEPMPALQTSKCKHTINLVTDNGRVISAGFCDIEMCEQDLIVMNDLYEWDDSTMCDNIYIAGKNYLPRWFTDYVFELFEAKSKLKYVIPFDPVNYSLSKSRVNGVYGLTVQAAIKPDIIEVIEPGIYQINEDGDMDYLESGEYREDFTKDLKKEYQKYINRKTSVLPYVIGVYCTAFAFKNLFALSKCVKRYYKNDGSGKLAFPPHWYYSDTDSAYSDDWDYNKIWQYNNSCKEKLKANGYGPVIVNGKEVWLGIAEHKPDEDTYSEFKVLGSKRYAGRHYPNGEISITVAGVPKKPGAKCLKDDLNNFKKDFIFRGEDTGKLGHFYILNDIHIDQWGNEVADSIDLKPCDYQLDQVNKWDFIESDDFYIPVNESEVTDIYEI